jgi:hypothetical protein
MSEEYKPRFSFEISEEQKFKADSLINVHGIRRALFSIILDDVLDLIDTHGNAVVGIILDGQAKPRDILPSMAKVERRLK